MMYVFQHVLWFTLVFFCAHVRVFANLAFPARVVAPSGELERSGPAWLLPLAAASAP